VRRQALENWGVLFNMTLIFTWLDSDKVGQMSDQRLTLLDSRLGGGVRLYDEHAIKTIYVDGADVGLLVSYTGIAYLTDRFRRTDHWLLEAIHPIAALVLPELAEALRERASAATASGAELTIIGAGYKKGTNLPIQFSVSNIEDADGERLPRASAEFTARF
jgi:hypothetical protein